MSLLAVLTCNDSHPRKSLFSFLPSPSSFLLWFPSSPSTHTPDPLHPLLELPDFFDGQDASLLMLLLFHTNLRGGHLCPPVDPEVLATELGEMQVLIAVPVVAQVVLALVCLCVLSNNFLHCFVVVLFVGLGEVNYK